MDEWLGMVQGTERERERDGEGEGLKQFGLQDRSKFQVTADTLSFVK